MVLGRLAVPERPTNLDNNRARTYCAWGRCGWGVVWTIFLSSFSPSLHRETNALFYMFEEIP